MGAVAVSRMLRQPSQIQVVGALALRFSCTNTWPQKIISTKLEDMQTVGGRAVAQAGKLFRTETE